MSFTYNPKSKISPKMLSRIGKTSSDRFMILTQKEAIISRKLNKRKISFASEVNEEEEPKTFLVISEILKREVENLSNLEESSRSAPHLSPSFKSQARDDYYNKVFFKPIAPPCGHYNPKFDAMRKHISSPRMKTVKIDKREAVTSERSFRPKSKKTKFKHELHHLQSAIPFNKQIKRGI